MSGALTSNANNAFSHLLVHRQRNVAQNLRWLLGAAKLILDENPGYCANPVLLRPHIQNRRGDTKGSALVVEKLSHGQDAEYDIKSNGFGLQEVIGMTEALGITLGTNPVYEAVDDRGKSLDINDVKQYAGACNVLAKFSNGLRVFWTADLSRLNVHCPNNQILEQLTAQFLEKDGIAH